LFMNKTGERKRSAKKVCENCCRTQFLKIGGVCRDTSDSEESSNEEDEPPRKVCKQ